jgi:hypothetical protein
VSAILVDTGLAIDFLRGCGVGVLPGEGKLGIVSMGSDGPRGAVVYEGWNSQVVWMHVAGRGGHWLTRDFLELAFLYPFKQLEAESVMAFVAETNDRCCKFVESLGFDNVAVLYGTAKGGDNEIIYRMRRGTWESAPWRKKHVR